MVDSWNANFYGENLIFDDLILPASFFAYHKKWPELEDYNRLLRQINTGFCSHSGARLKFVQQAGKPQTLADSYEARIYLNGDIQTRLQNWHDFFQVMAWCTYPQTKRQINAMHYRALSSRPQAGRRSEIENALTLFDECGAIIASSDPALLEQVRAFNWYELFVQHRNAFEQDIRCFIFGHALFEKCLNPYIGMTAHCILLHVEEDFFKQPKAAQQARIDETACTYFKDNPNIGPQSLQPFPLLGVPGWDSRNANPVYYQNTDYFRPGRNRRKKAL